MRLQAMEDLMEDTGQPESMEQGATPADAGADLEGETISMTDSKVNNINADQITLSESMARNISAKDVDMAQSLAMRIQSEYVEMNNSGAGLVQANTVVGTNTQVMLAQANELNVENASLGVALAGTADVVNGRVGLLMTRELHGEAIQSTILLSGRVDGDVQTVLDTPRAMLVGLTAGIAIGLVFLISSLLLKRK
jgi:hypothetical protein